MCSTRSTPGDAGGSRSTAPRPQPETVAIDFEGRRFVWHAIEPDEAGTEYWPTVTTIVGEDEDETEVAQAFERFCSALAYIEQTSIEPLGYGGAGWAGEMDPPVARHFRRGLAGHLHGAPTEVIVQGDDRLRVCLAHFRDGLNTSSPFFRFLAFWNALDVACDDYPGRLPAWVAANAAARWNEEEGENPAPTDVWEYLTESGRHAIAHAVRDGRGPEIDPDDPEDRVRLGRDAALVRQLVGQRIRERWGDYAVRPGRGLPG